MVDVNSGELVWSSEGQLSYVTIIPLLPFGLNSERSIARAMAREITAAK
jgi:hypothetical protein